MQIRMVRQNGKNTKIQVHKTNEPKQDQQIRGDNQKEPIEYTIKDLSQ